MHVRLELYHLAHGLFPRRQLSAPPPEAPALPTDVHAVDAVPLAFPLARDRVVSEAPVRGIDVSERSVRCDVMRMVVSPRSPESSATVKVSKIEEAL